MFYKILHIILFLIIAVTTASSGFSQSIRFEFLGDTIELNQLNKSKIAIKNGLSDETIADFYRQMNNSDNLQLISQLLEKKKSLQLNDWLYYQLIRNTAEQLSPKATNYNQYTLVKWFLLAKSGYDATLSYSKDYLLFYVRSEDNIYGIPYFEKNNHQYICLNIHDYSQIDFTKETVLQTTLIVPEGKLPFSYKITQMPDFKPNNYAVKELQFNYQDKVYHFEVKLNPEVKKLFNNYPVADFSTYFNIPLSKETYGSLIPALKKNIQNMSQQDGIDYLMHFTRYAFLYETDQQNFGKEKRLSPEQTLLYDQSDCDDRAALFFYLVKEIYNKAMIAVLYPTHITIAVQLENPVGKPIIYNGKAYSICDPTPQQNDLSIGQVSKNLKHTSYEVVYEYNPIHK
jgi:hypothetical protein